MRLALLSFRSSGNSNRSSNTLVVEYECILYTTNTVLLLLLLLLLFLLLMLLILIVLTHTPELPD